MNQLEVKKLQIEKLEALAWAIKALEYKTDAKQIVESIDKILEIGKAHESTTIN